jgi:hypothetical protein
VLAGLSTRLHNLEEIAQLTALGEDMDADVRKVLPSHARKTYVCPGCQQQINPAVGHVVVVPRQAPDLRRHWHTPCWMMRERRRPGK